MMHQFGGYSPFMSWGPGMGFGVFGIFAVVLIVAVLLLKGYALWIAAKRDEKCWFIALFLINTAGILELVYLLFIVKKWPHVMNGVKNGSNTSSSSATSSNENNNGPKTN